MRIVRSIALTPTLSRREREKYWAVLNQRDFRRMISLRIEHLSKCFGDTIALDDINLSVAAGELFFLLGPSGCGKSTLLRLVAGLYQPTSGRMFFNDRDVTPLPTEQRNAVMVFQSYALWPHMTV